MTRTGLKASTIMFSILLLFVIYKIGGVVVALVYFGVIFVLMLLYFMSQNSRLMLKLNLEKFSKAISCRFEDYGGAFASEGTYLKMPVGFREVTTWKGTELEVYCRPAVFNAQLSGKKVYPSPRTVVKPGVVCLQNAGELFFGKELNGLQITEMLEELKKAAAVVETGNQPYRIETSGGIYWYLALVFTTLLFASLFLVFRILSR